MEYWVYEHWSAEHKAVVHAASCGFCNHGQGTSKRKPRGDANGEVARSVLDRYCR